ncbi:hypothetical protein PDG61_11985 [Mycolicibacterium sp. BiH015]|nr:hypothetical protein [Mycolicibacterium sp. BiH015]MDA2891635.1 hypothetical protein [Mycolicibacterium sp. BiH015]
MAAGPPSWAEAVADENLEIAARLPVGAIVTRKLENFFVRGAFF